jgi:hypothetical protein
MSESSLGTGVKIIKKTYKVGLLPASSTNATLTSSSNASTDELHKTVIENESVSNVESAQTEVASMALTAEQKEALIEKMETRKHKIKTEYRETNDPELKRQYHEVCELLARVKECDAIDKMQDNIQDGTKLASDFRKKYKELAVTDFNRIIDLTASKAERKPDITTETWQKGRTVVFKDKVYRPPPQEKLEKFQQKMTLKPMPTELKRNMESNMEGNLRAANIRKHQPELIKYKHYDPMDFQGLNAY